MLAGPLPLRRCSLNGGLKQQVQQVVDLRHKRLDLRHFAGMLGGGTCSIVAQAQSQLAQGRLRNLEPNLLRSGMGGSGLAT